MVATQSQQGINAKSYELTQQAKDAKNACVNIKMDNGKCQNLEQWRKGIDVMLGLLTALHYVDKNNNIYLKDAKQLLLAKAEVQMAYTSINQIRKREDEDEDEDEIQMKQPFFDQMKEPFEELYEEEKSTMIKTEHDKKEIANKKNDDFSDTIKTV